MEEIDTDGIKVEVDDVGMNPYGEGVVASGTNLSENIQNEEDLPVMDLSSTVSSLPNSEHIDPELEKINAPLSDYSSQTEVLDETDSANAPEEDSMVSDDIDLPVSSIDNSEEDDAIADENNESSSTEKYEG